jgi:hypothetical protein
MQQSHPNLRHSSVGIRWDVWASHSIKLMLKNFADENFPKILTFALKPYHGITLVKIHELAVRARQLESVAHLVSRVAKKLNGVCGYTMHP